MRRILLVKTSSMGDVIHNLPVATDIARRFPGAAIDWVVEESFAAIPAMHPAVSEAIPVALRRWRKSPLSRAVRDEFSTFRQRLRSRKYDSVLDTQGLLKSALLAAMARGPRCGHDASSAREAVAALFYGRRCAVPRGLHAVERNRRLAAGCLDYDLGGPPDYGIEPPAAALPWLERGRCAVFLHGTSRADKLWPEERWVALGRQLAARGIFAVLPWGSADEEARSRRLASAIGDARVAPRLDLGEAATLLGRAVVAVGTDTGLTHLAAALRVPVVGLYVATDPGLTGVVPAGPGLNLGGAGKPPGVDEVLAAIDGFGLA